MSTSIRALLARGGRLLQWPRQLSWGTADRHRTLQRLGPVHQLVRDPPVHPAVGKAIAVAAVRPTGFAPIPVPNLRPPEYMPRCIERPVRPADPFAKDPVRRG